MRVMVHCNNIYGPIVVDTSQYLYCDLVSDAPLSEEEDRPNKAKQMELMLIKSIYIYLI